MKFKYNSGKIAGETRTRKKFCFLPECYLNPETGVRTIYWLQYITIKEKCIALGTCIEWYEIELLETP